MWQPLTSVEFDDWEGGGQFILQRAEKPEFSATGIGQFLSIRINAKGVQAIFEALFSK